MQIPGAEEDFVISKEFYTHTHQDQKAHFLLWEKIIYYRPIFHGEKTISKVSGEFFLEKVACSWLKTGFDWSFLGTIF